MKHGTAQVTNRLKDRLLAAFIVFAMFRSDFDIPVVVFGMLVYVVIMLDELLKKKSRQGRTNE